MKKYHEQSMQIDINRIHLYVSQISSLAENGLLDCSEAIKCNDRKLAYTVILRDRTIQEKTDEIDRLCLEFLVRNQPVDKYLRFAHSTLRINKVIGRIGENTGRMAQNILKIAHWPTEKNKQSGAKLALLSMSIFKDATLAYIGHDAQNAYKWLVLDDQNDEIRSSFTEQIVHTIENNEIPAESLSPFLSIIDILDQVIDQTRSLCHEVIYMCTGHYSKYFTTQTFQVLRKDANASNMSKIN
ncbi:hypothetical protein JW979_00795 [bacterium]|nr:hypothetical protein [candidate division CSSED10-310 bacterium]